MALHERLPDSLAAQYSELLRHAVRPTPDGSNLSFKAKRVRGWACWYLYVSLGRRRTEHYLGAETPELCSTRSRASGTCGRRRRTIATCAHAW